MTNTIPTFLWSIIKPYKWWYLLMMQAPLINCTYKIFSTYAVKLVVDTFTSSAIPEYSDFIFPITVFISSILIMEMGWRVSHFAWMKSQPFVRANIVAKSYDYIQNHSYVFFQNTQSGSIVSKIKGILADTIICGLDFIIASRCLCWRYLRQLLRSHLSIFRSSFLCCFGAAFFFQ